MHFTDLLASCVTFRTLCLISNQYCDIPVPGCDTKTYTSPHAAGRFFGCDTKKKAFFVMPVKIRRQSLSRTLQTVQRYSNFPSATEILHFAQQTECHCTKHNRIYTQHPAVNITHSTLQSTLHTAPCSQHYTHFGC